MEPRDQQMAPSILGARFLNWQALKDKDLRISKATAVSGVLEP